MPSHYTEAEAETIRAFVRRRKREREQDLVARLEAARKACDVAVALIVREVDPQRIYLWGSLVHSRHFSEMSDIDIAVEGAPDPTRLYEASARAQRATEFDLDIVRLESVHPAYADHIRRRGRLVYEREEKPRP